eukprot:14082305-Alexandrium_andersonii.AAC.1
MVAQRSGRQRRPEGRGRPLTRGTKCEAARHPGGSVLEQFHARPRPALTGWAHAHPDLPKNRFWHAPDALSGG